MADARIKAILDTSIYIPFVNGGVVHPSLEIDIGKPVIYLSTVVIAELYAGAFDNQSIKLLDKLYKAFYDTQRIVTPTSNDWQTTGKVVAKLGGKYGFENIFLSRIQNDVLIALSAKQVGASVITNNAKDFLRVKEFVNFKLIA
ncbi:MAG: PIN domain protein [Candidatus Brocadia sinica]|uniref:PIN domain-containing protein n=1 Tax=Candidatus Brocadia sinica JPN1 TaxID=1197129 RepID=A0ABQ0JY71_9BACT|nr:MULTISPECIES: type II toxin-antitoxin system VapC family toxin [Brocadia]KXK29957.1 MAG: PIN domain protein [Candidatus Brocadia sinica]NOG40567.1 type II toxin-antitoxin system VapC family toxin [Planctomycetota bacterium]MCK6467536.1 type II toxin-antitoxin system VapC family toxin [Candidatus Brocadia sinica]NUO05149.1 type II toxin-antitoxin system VapC family toxin [Candidatus Brocadia sinica]GAN33631.1 hypothetical protein BROSI_A2157 [Candidatus Brocadia sinica JPN1]